MSTLGKFWRIILSYKWGLLVQFALFIGVSVAFTIFMGDNELSDEFLNVEDVQIAIFDHDQTELTQNFVSFMADLHDIVEVDESAEVWLDAVTLGGVPLILEIPIGFTDGLVNGNNEVQMEYLLNPNSMDGFFVHGQVERYFSILRSYLAGGFDVTDAGLLVTDTLGNGVEIELVRVSDEMFGDVYPYFRFLPLSLVMVVAIAMGGVFLALGKQDVTRRIESAPMSYKRRTLERIMACLTFGVLAWGIFISVAFVLFGDSMIQIDNLVRLVNSFPLILLGIALALIITQFIEKRDMLYTIVLSVVMTLVMLGGIMFDLAMMGEQVRAVARLTPLYWYTRVNDMLLFESIIDWMLVWQGIVIQIAFATAIIAVGMVFNKERRAKLN